MIRLEYKDLSREELKQLDRMVRMTPFYTKMGVYTKTRQGDMTIWAYRENGANVILLLEVHSYDTGRALNIFGVFGKGLLKNHAEIELWLNNYAVCYQCRWITAWAARSGAERLHMAVGAKPVATLSVKEV